MWGLWSLVFALWYLVFGIWYFVVGRGVNQVAQVNQVNQVIQINQVNRVTQVEQVTQVIQVSQVTHEVHLGSTWGSHRSTWGQLGIVCVVLVDMHRTNSGSAVAPKTND